MEEELMTLQEKLLHAAYEEIEHNCEGVNTCELGKVIDMVKDLSETMYYWTTVAAMKKGTSVTNIITPMN